MATIEITAAEGRQVMAVGSNYWGKGKTATEALRQIRKEGLRKGATVVFFDAPEGTVVNEIGNFQYWPPDGSDWDKVKEETGKGPTEWANIHEVGRGKS